MSDVSDLLQRSLRDVHPRAGLAERAIARHARRRRRRRIAGGFGAAVLAAAAAVLSWAALETTPDNAGITVEGTPSPQPSSKSLTSPAPAPGIAPAIPQTQRRAAPVLEGTTIDGKQLQDPLSRGSNSHVPGYISVVNFCGSWSAPCRAEQKAFDSLSPGPGFDHTARLIGVDERDSLATIRSYVHRFHLTYPVIFDDGKLAQIWGATVGPPVTFVIDGEGRIAARFDGEVSRSQLSQVIKVLLFEMPQSRPLKPAPAAKPTEKASQPTSADASAEARKTKAAASAVG